MSGPRLQVLVSGSKKWVWTMPSSWASLLPPATNTDPSTRWARPLQKMLKPVQVHRRLRAGRGVPDRRAGVVVDVVALGRQIAHRVVGEDLPVLEQRDVDPDDRPIDDRPPTAELARILGGARAAAAVKRSGVAASVRRSNRRSVARSSGATASSSRWPAAVLTEGSCAGAGGEVAAKSRATDTTTAARRATVKNRLNSPIPRRADRRSDRHGNTRRSYSGYGVVATPIRDSRVAPRRRSGG